MRNLRLRVVILEAEMPEIKKLLVGSRSGRRQVNLGHGL